MIIYLGEKFWKEMLMDCRGRKLFWRLIPGGLALTLFLLLNFLSPLAFLGPSQAQALNLNANPPAAPVRLVFIHHSVGANWLSDDNGNLLRELNANNYYVSDAYYGWGPVYDPATPESGTIGDYTDIGHWYDWFLGPRSSTFLGDLYPTTHLTPAPDVTGVNTIAQPPGDNTVVLFKSCFVSAYLITGNPDDPPRKSSPADPNPIWGSADGSEYTVSNIKGLYRDLLSFFATRQDRLFILVTTPPSSYDDPDLTRSSAILLRAINTWLVRHWLDNYPYNNVAVFDFHNVLTSNGGNTDTNDLGAATGNHHRLRNGLVQHVVNFNNNFSAYTPSGDSHPGAPGSQKATAEFLPLLNVAHNAWKSRGGRPLLMGRSPKAGSGLQMLLLD